MNTNFGQCDRRFLRYPNRRVATSAWPLTRQHLRRGHVGNPITNEAQLMLMLSGVDLCISSKEMSNVCTVQGKELAW